MPSIGGLRLRVELSALAIGGQLLDLSDPKSIKLMVGGSKLDAPYSLGAYGGTGADTAVVVVLQANLHPVGRTRRGGERQAGRHHGTHEPQPPHAASLSSSGASSICSHR